ncbi:MAG: hypothetical protein O7G85_00035 [Planctomycetota bacterium]|nr:hypothetical protein [Planctomycetota bacterium]
MHMRENDRHPALAGSGYMLFSAALFGYFGFLMGMTPYNTSNQLVMLFASFIWVLRGVSIGFALSAVLTFANGLIGNLVYSVVGLLSALGFVGLAVWDVLDTQYTLPSMPMIPAPMLLLLFAAWNGYGSWQGLRAVLALQKRQSDQSIEADLPRPE